MVVALGALLLTIRPVGAQSDGAPQLTIVPPNTVEHNENDDGAVYTFVATDPEGRTIFWTLSGTDADDFEITNGVLKFKIAPDYEIPRDGTRDNTPVAESDGVYEVTVRFSDGGNAAEHAMKVEVQDVGEAGEIMLSPIQPQVGTPLQAVIIDLDGVSTNAAGVPLADYQWAKSETMTATPTDIVGATGQSYTPTEDDESSYLQVTVTYLEHASTRPAKTEVGTATLPVRPDTHMNVAPAVPLTGQGQMKTGADNDNAIIRYIAEDAEVGSKVGPPVTAVDDNLDLLTYALVPVATGTDDPTDAQIADAAPFDIDPESGQITTNRLLDFAEATAPEDFDDRDVVVTATDPDGEVLSIRVEIRVTDVDEPPAPLFANDPTREVIIMENSEGDARHVGTYTAATFAQDPDDTDTPVTLTIAGDDALTDDDDPKFEFEGDVLQFTDAFDIDYENPGDANGDNLYHLTVVATDATSMTSSLSVTVKVTNDPTDDNNNTAGTLEIFNRQPEVNTLLDVTGPPTDTDGNVRSVRWQWYWQTILGASAETPSACPAFVPYDPDSIGTTGDPDLNDASLWMKIDGATSKSYMPTLDRIDTYDTVAIPPDDRADATAAFDCLMVRASYLDDGPRSADDSSTTDYDESRQYAYAVSDFSVQPEDTDNEEPEFQDGDTALAGIQVRPRIQENFPQSTDPDPTQIFSAVALATETAQASTAGDFLTSLTSPTEGVIRILDGTFPSDDDDGIIENSDGIYDADDFTSANSDADSDNHKLTFAISGPDVGSFGVDKATGAITFTASPDYEVLAERRYTVTLTAHDPTNASDSITVIVDVENLDEDPVFNPGGATVTYDENSTDTVATYTGSDPESDRFFWGLTGTDAALFDLGVINGRLTFRNAPNYEDPQDADHTDTPADGPTNNIYNVVVHLLKDGESVTDVNNVPAARSRAVAITVADVAEAPVFTKTTDDNDMVIPSELNIAENKHPDTMLNRAVENSPQASDEDEIPEDDMYASVALVYTISGAGTEALSIVPATGELRTTRILDYEDGDRSFEVKVTATDPTKPMGLMDSIDLIINVTDEDEAPVGGGTNQAPVFDSATMTRSVAENTEAGIDIGDPITATDPQDQTIEYTLGGPDMGHFDIDMAMGQLKTMGALDRESKDTYTVTVTATDDDATSPMSDETTVTIMVTDESELGTLAGDDEPTYAEDRMDAVETYTVSGGTMDDMAEWTVSGDDADAFTIPGGALTFNNQPDFEDPMGGAGNDPNTYMVTVMASAGGEMKMMDVAITVTNVEEGGTVDLDPTRPSVGTEITATLEDPDNVVGTVSWQWATHVAPADGSMPAADSANWTDITTNGDMASYTPVAAGEYLRAMASYEDGHDSGKSASMVSESAVTEVPVNVAPVFEEGTATTRSIAENTAANTNIGEPVTATDDNDDTLTYSLSLERTDAASFRINASTGQLRTFAALDYETKMTYTVDVKATDPGGLSDTITVTISVTDVDDGTVTPMDPVDTYDTDVPPDGIQIDELFAAIDDYFNDDIQLSIEDLFAIIDAFFTTNG